MVFDSIKRIALGLALLLAPTAASAQCNGVFGANTICGRLTSTGIPGPLPNSVLTGVPGGTNGQVQYNNLSNFGGFTVGGDATLTPLSGLLTLTPSGVTAGTYGDGLNIPRITFDAKGRATTATVLSPTAFTGDTGTNGSIGAIPAPLTPYGIQQRVLGAGGSWVGLSNIGNIGLTTPMDFGAKCDGTTVDTAISGNAIQKWLNSLSGFAATGWLPPGRTCVVDGLLSIGSKTRMYLNNGTFLAKPSGLNNTSFVCGPTSQLGGPVDAVEIYGGIFDWNRSNRTDSLTGSANLYCISVTNLIIEDTRFDNNGQGDGLYLGGTTTAGGQGRSALGIVRNARATNNYRNNFSIVGFDRLDIFGGKWNSASNNNADGPQCGVDFEPNDANSTNTNISVFGGSASGNGHAGLTPTGGSGWCVFGAVANTTNLQFHGIEAGSNIHYGIHTFTPVSATQVRLHGMNGTGNLSGISLNVIDFFPNTISTGAANSGGAGFRYITIPN